MNRTEVTVSLFDQYAAQYEDKYLRHPPYIETYQYLSDCLADDAKILDLACGPGTISRFLLDQKPTLNVHGIDLSANMIELAKKNCPAAQFDIADIRQLSFLNRSFDAIISGFCAPYLSPEDLHKHIADVRKLLKPGGIFYLSTIEGSHEQSGYSSNDKNEQMFTYYYQEEFLLSLLSSNNFQLLRTDRKSQNTASTTDLFIYAEAV